MDIGRITSRQNRLVREAAALAADGEKRREKGLFLCEGARLCQDAARSGVGVEICFFTPQAREQTLLEHPELFQTPIVRNGREATVGYCPEVWETWT